MKLSDIQEISQTQRQALDEQKPGLIRHILPDLPALQSHALVISGIRRCGKSTLLRQYVQNLGKPYFYLNFDDIRLSSFNQNDYTLLDKAINENEADVLFFDEIQSADKWELYIRQKLDEGYNIAITGSNASLLSRELGSRLTGRHLTHELFPFSYKEFCSFFNLDNNEKSLSEYMEKGGFPEFLKSGNTDILAQLQSDILYRDIAVRYGIRDAASLKQLFVYIISNFTQISSPSKLTGITGVKSPTTVLEYISYLESSYLISFLPCFSWSAKSQSLTPKKIYIIDSGLVKTSSVSFTKNNGAFLENFVYNTIRRTTKDIYYFKSKNDKECDFIVNAHSNPSCIQVCWELSQSSEDREINGLLEAMEFFNLNDGLIITFNTEDLILTGGKKIQVQPAWKYNI